MSEIGTSATCAGSDVLSGLPSKSAFGPGLIRILAKLGHSQTVGEVAKRCNSKAGITFRPSPSIPKVAASLVSFGSIERWRSLAETKEQGHGPLLSKPPWKRCTFDAGGWLGFLLNTSAFFFDALWNPLALSASRLREA